MNECCVRFTKEIAAAKPMHTVSNIGINSVHMMTRNITMCTLIATTGTITEAAVKAELEFETFSNSMMDASCTSSLDDERDAIITPMTPQESVTEAV